MNCPQCGATLEEGNSRCSQCGASVAQETAAQENTASEAAQSTTPPPPSGFPAPPAQPAAPSGQPVVPAQPVASSQPAAPGQPGVPGQYEQAPKKDSKKVRNIIIGIVAAVLVIIAIVVGVFAIGEATKANNYDSGITLMQSGEYAEAEDLFRELDDYKDSKELLGYCKEAQQYESAMALKEAGDFEGAKAAFTKLYDFEDSQEQVQACQYALADILLEEGKREEAYNAFLEISGFEDSLERAEACVLPFPETGEVSRNEGFFGSDGILTIDSDDASTPTYIKIYSLDNTLVSAITLRPQEKLSLDFPAGDYVVKLASGERWFGDEDLFGAEGYYGGNGLLDTGAMDLTIQRNYEHFLSIYDTTTFGFGGGDASSF